MPRQDHDATVIHNANSGGADRFLQNWLFDHFDGKRARLSNKLGFPGSVRKAQPAFEQPCLG